MQRIMQQGARCFLQKEGQSSVYDAERNGNKLGFCKRSALSFPVFPISMFGYSLAKSQ